MKTYISILFLFLGCHTFAQKSRQLININQNWSFAKDVNQKGIKAINKWQTVSLPHTWNAFDVMDDEPGYYRGVGWYKKKLVLNPEWKSKKIYLYLEGANQETEVYLNGAKLGSHVGGYTSFTFALNGLTFNGADQLEIKVNNRHNESIPPLTGDFTFFGGIYRSVSLLVVDPIHFEDEKYASSGVFAHADKVNKQYAELKVKGNITNQNVISKPIKIVSILRDRKGKIVGEVSAQTNLAVGQTTFSQPSMSLQNPILWSPEQPYLYQVHTQIQDANTGKIIDEVKSAVGFRFFSFDAKNGFFLNGEPYKLIGASRHQDFAGLGNAVSKELQVKDIALLKEMGGNFLRVAHYPQDQAVLDACDSLGLLTSVEIPIVNEITESDAFTANSKHMQLEMIWQNYNHPSVIIWAYMNEVLLKMRHHNDPDRKQVYLKNIEKLAQELEDLTRKTDPTRYTMMSNHGDVNGYVNAGLVKIPQLVGWNLYQGWYGGKSEDFGPNLDRIHAQIPDKPLLVTEYGADVDPRIHAFNPLRFDKSLEYGMLYHQIYIKDILKRPFVAGAAAWNLSDFSSETREETMPHVNNKGLLTLAREPKNTFYLYRAYFNPKPFLKIGDGTWKWRAGIAKDNETIVVQPLQVISNLDSMAVWHNGKPLGKQKAIEHLTTWDVPFNDGENKIKAMSWRNGTKLEDEATIQFRVLPQHINEANARKGINLLLGSQRQFIDPKNQIWLPSQGYQNGSWGSLGGEPFKVKSTSRQSYGTDKNIRGTANDPIYQTQLIGLDGYQLDVPKGKYEVVLHFAELMGSGISVLPYNLDSLIAVDKVVPAQRIFNVYLNEKQIIKNINLAATYGTTHMVVKRFECLVSDEKGLRLRFESVNGKPVLNALQVRKIN